MSAEQIYDPLRRKNVAFTPEERVRQWFISVLMDDLGVPRHQMMSEVELKFSGKTYRADLIVYGRGGVRKAIVECKREEVQLTREVLEQALRYNMVLDVGFLIITNGTSTYAFHKAENGWKQLERLPDYEQICNE